MGQGAIDQSAIAELERSPIERKLVLVNGELDRLGLGRYQKCIWLLCGFGYFVDLAWAQAIALIAAPLYQEMNVPEGRQGTLSSCFNAGLAVGALGFGVVTDIIGRKWAFNLTLLMTSVFGLLLASVKYNYAAVCALAFLCAIGLGGNVPIDSTIALEFLPQNRRYLVSLLGIWQPVGLVTATALAYGTVPRTKCSVDLPACRSAGLAPGADCCTVTSNLGWRYLVIAVGCISLVLFIIRFFVFPFHESPKFLIGKGKDQEAITALQKIAKFNRKPPPTLTLDDLVSQDDLTVESNPSSYQSVTVAKMKVKQQVSFLSGLFSDRAHLISFCLLAVAYMGDFWSFNLAGFFLPIILLRNNVDSGAITLSETYLQYIYIYTPGMIGAVIAVLSVQLPLVGRKWSLVVSAALQGLSMAMYTQVKNTAGYVGLNALEYIMQTYFNAVLYASTPEMFGTASRASAAGMLSCLGRIAGIVAPIAGQNFISSGGDGVLWLGAGGIWLACVSMCFLPIEMRNAEML